MMRNSFRKAGLAALGAVVGLVTLTMPGAAHHSTAMFVWGEEVSLKNMTIERWVWTNPHTFIYAHDAEGNRWAFEGMSPNHLSRNGWNRRSLQPGEKVDLTYYVLRDGRRGGFNVRVIKEDGTELSQFPSRM